MEVIYTNLANLPAPLVSALKFSDYQKVGHISVTELPTPPRLRQLRIRHSDEIIQDVSELIWMLVGNVGHKILERADTDNHLAEERMTIQRLGWKISGKADLLGPDMCLDDYKFTSVWAMKNAKPEWEAQLNIYALMYREHGFTVKQARIIAVLRDWSKSKAAREPDYPQVGVVVREVPLWSADHQQAYLFDRIMAHKVAAAQSDDTLPECTDEETWKRPTQYAIKDPKRKRALKLCASREEAAALLEGKQFIEERPGQYVRCTTYCPVSKFCSQFKAVLSLQESQGSEQLREEPEP